ncbi:putative HPr kinase [Gammaproteobacteria bacterium]
MSSTCEKPRMKYSLHGITVETPFPCPELLPASGAADVSVKWGKMEPPAVPWRDEGVCYKAAPGKYLLSVKGVADYFVANGDEVIIDPAPRPDEDALRLFFYNEVIGALLMQRGALLLKGCVVERDGRAYAFTGPTPSGKTMLAARLAQRGFRIVADGFFCLTNNKSSGNELSGNGTPLVQPGYPSLMSWEKSLNELGISSAELKPVRTGMHRYYLPQHSSFHNEAVNLAAIHILTSHNRAELSIEEAKGAEKLFALLPHRYHPKLAASLGMGETQNRIAAKLANSVKVSIVRHNDMLIPFREFVERMEQELEKTTP